MTARGVIAAVVLAAGGSTRLGKPKQLLPLGEHPLLAHVLHCVRQSSVDRKYIVLGFAEDQIREQVPLHDFEIIHNQDYFAGQSTSIRRTIETMPDDVSAVVFVLGDQPLQVPEVIDTIIGSYRDDPAPAVQPQFADGPGNPVLIDRELFGELLELTGDTGARPVLRELGDRIRRIDCSAYRRPSDVDTWEDYEAVKRYYASMNIGDHR